MLLTQFIVSSNSALVRARSSLEMLTTSERTTKENQRHGTQLLSDTSSMRKTAENFGIKVKVKRNFISLGATKNVRKRKRPFVCLNCG